ncbi:allophanate hydrolase subunit 1 [Nocardioides sp.]|uniref:5-oxoprolinase subunit B family protein n=1 Tax=Nocardioides sp. TaxID=35761 RepID=UPI00261E59F3|nr:allophanate hydrolase subunit 1 [Nocardioides sp.]
MRLRQCGARAVLVEVDDAAQASSLALWARAAGVQADEIVPAALTVLFDGVERAVIEEAVLRWEASAAGAGVLRSSATSAAASRVVEVPTVYDGADLAEVAGLWGCSVEAVVARHTSVEFTSLFCGFAPGFAYLAGLPGGWEVPRRAEPRAAVPVGSVALAGAWCGVYPTSSPGGWQLLGRTDLVLWDLEAPSPATLAPGTRVRFVAVRPVAV